MKKRKIRKVSRKKKAQAKEIGHDVLKLTCCLCKRVFEITVNKIEVYTEEVIKTWKCLMCNDKKGRK